MHTIWQALAWKEWQEHKWKLAALTAILAGVSSMPFFDPDRMSFGTAPFLAMFCIVPLAMFIGASIATGERSRGTLEFTQALPVPLWRVAAHKLVAGALTCVLPVVANTLLVLALYALFHFAQVKPTPTLTLPLIGSLESVDIPTWTINSIGIAALMALSVFTWTAAIGARSKDEISASAWTLLAIALWWGILINAIIFQNLRVDDETLPHLLAASPGGWLTYASIAMREDASLRWGTALAIGMQLLLAIAFLFRFAAADGGSIQSRKSAITDGQKPTWLAPPFASCWSATIWKQFRESRPIALAGLAGIGLTSLMITAAAWQQIDLANLGSVVGGVSAYFGLLVTLVIAIGLFLNDLEPQLHTFWRSRPIEPNQYFWLKFFTGLLVLAAAFSIPFLFAAVTAGIGHFPDFAELLLFGSLVPIWLYCAVVMMTCILRHAIYAPILGGAAMYLSFLLVVGASRVWLLASSQIPWEEWNDPSSGEVAASMILGSIAFTIIAWLCVRNDWGAKSRY